MLASRGIICFLAFFLLFGALLQSLTYLEEVKPVKVTWQEESRFQDSSSERDDEPETSEMEKERAMQVPFVFVVYLVVVVARYGSTNGSTQETGN